MVDDIKPVKEGGYVSAECRKGREYCWCWLLRLIVEFYTSFLVAAEVKIGKGVVVIIAAVVDIRELRYSVKEVFVKAGVTGIKVVRF